MDLGTYGAMAFAPSSLHWADYLHTDVPCWVLACWDSCVGVTWKVGVTHCPDRDSHCLGYGVPQHGGSVIHLDPHTHMGEGIPRCLARASAGEWYTSPLDMIVKLRSVLWSVW